MKNRIIFLLALFALNSVNAQGCLPEGILFTTQAQVDSFPINYPGCTEIEGDVQIGPDLNHWLTDITDLNGLNSLNYIGGSLGIFCNPFSSLSGLENLNYIGGTLQIGRLNYPYVQGNPNLVTLAGLDGLDSIGGDLVITLNQGLINLSGLESLSVIRGNLTIGKPGNTMWGGNSSLINLTGLNNLTFVRTVTIRQNAALASLTGLEGLTSINGSLTIQGNSSLVELTGLNNLGSVSVGLELTYNSSLVTLSGLNNLSSVGYWFVLGENNSLESLSGLDHLDSIGGGMNIGYCCGGVWTNPPPGGNAMLVNLNGLENLRYVGGGIKIGDNDSLTSLAGLDNIDAGSVTSLEIGFNKSLSTCEVQSVCNYLSSPNGTITIEYNAPGCNSQEEVEAACLVGLEDLHQYSLNIYPNPSSGKFTIEFTLQYPSRVNLIVLNHLGQLVATLADETLPPGLQQVTWNAGNLPAGIYYYHLQAGNKGGIGKIVVIK